MLYYELNKSKKSWQKESKAKTAYFFKINYQKKDADEE